MYCSKKVLFGAFIILGICDFFVKSIIYDFWPQPFLCFIKMGTIAHMDTTLLLLNDKNLSDQREISDNLFLVRNQT